MKTKVAIKSENITSFGGIFYVIDEFSHLEMDKLIDRVLDLRCRTYGYQYSEILSSLFYTYYCGDDHIEDIGHHLGPHLELRPNTLTKKNAVTFRALLPSVFLLLVLKIVTEMPTFVFINQTH